MNWLEVWCNCLIDDGDVRLFRIKSQRREVCDPFGQLYTTWSQSRGIKHSAEELMDVGDIVILQWIDS